MAEESTRRLLARRRRAPDVTLAAPPTPGRQETNTLAEAATSAGGEAPGDVEVTMQKISLPVSLAGLGLMVAGFVGMLSRGAWSSVPGRSVLPLPQLVHIWQDPLNLALMSAGIVLLALLPIVRVLLALWLYIRQRNGWNIVVALLVFLELLLSIWTGG